MRARRRFLHGNRVSFQEGLHPWGVLGQRIAMFLVLIVCSLSDYFLFAFAKLLTVANVCLRRHILNGVIYVLPEGRWKGMGTMRKPAAQKQVGYGIIAYAI